MIYLVLFLNTFLFYLYHAFPTIAAYRDSGEFATVGYILGVAHPPGYPLYTLLIYILGRIIPFGNFGYKINIVSCIFSALTAVILFYLFKLIIDKYIKQNKVFFLILGYFAILCFSFGYLQWYLSLVSEMYTFNTFFASVIVLLTFMYHNLNKKYIYLLFFIFALGITNRLDIVLFFPCIIFALIDYIKFKKSIKSLHLLLILFLIGISVYLYLPIRSSSQPFIDWNNPEQLNRFWASLTRKTHGSTLDLISSKYKTSENFSDGVKFYFSHILKNLGFIGILLVIFGLDISSYFGLSLFLSWLFSSMFFIYKANMPPNPHAFAILEAHFLLPNVVIWVWFMLGVFFVYNRYSYVFKYLIVVILYILSFNILENYKKLNKRNNFYAYDYSINVLRTIPSKSIIVVKEDVQLFSLWYKSIVERNRKDVHIISAGLSGSIWYKEMYSRRYEEKPFIGPLNNNQEWEEFIKQNFNLGYKIFISYDVESPQIKNFILKPHGLLLKVLERKDNEKVFTDFLFENIYILRGRYIYDLNFDFFCSDLIEDYSKALLNSAHWLTKHKIMGLKNEYFYKYSILMNPIYPYGYFELGYFYYLLSLLDDALLWYKTSAKKFEEYIELAKKYKAFDDVVNEIRMNLANCYLHLGVVLEKKGMRDEAINVYNKSLEYNPYFADAYYNLAVIYWYKKDWYKVKYYLEQTLKLNPYHKEAKFFLNLISQ
ncbi:MAG: DUF2723 domain-containing protein [Endomicrobia bacterium]|nr:DUF2723 domain-containing protein [Endomicrobiia bacterium]